MRGEPYFTLKLGAIGSQEARVRKEPYLHLDGQDVRALPLSWPPEDSHSQPLPLAPKGGLCCMTRTLARTRPAHVFCGQRAEELLPETAMKPRHMSP